MLPSLDEKSIRRIPQALIYPTKEIEIIRMKIRIFLSMRHMIFTLTQNDGSINQKTKENPMKKEEREVMKWVQGQVYDINPSQELILCNVVNASQKKEPRYVIID